MSGQDNELIDRLVRLIRRAIDADHIELAIDDVVIQSGQLEGGDVLVREEHLSWLPCFGPAEKLAPGAGLSGDIATYPITGPSAEPGVLLAFSKTSGRFTEETLNELDNAIVLVQSHLDQAVERLRLDQITDALRQNQDDLHTTQAQLELSNNELEQFAYIAAHELVAPLRTVAVYAEVLDMNAKDLDELQLRSATREIREGVAMMDRQVRQLLELSSTQEQAAEPVPVDLASIADAAIERLREDLTHAGAEVTVRILPVVHGRTVLLQSVFVNLISNAVKYRDPSTPVKILIESTTDEGTHRVTVTDNGPGIEAQDQERIFRLFERASTAAPGSGIGLGLSRRIIEAFGGTLGYESPDGGGSRFILTFPSLDAEHAMDHDVQAS